LWPSAAGADQLRDGNVEPIRSLEDSIDGRQTLGALSRSCSAVMRGEKVVYGEVSTGVLSDIQNLTRIGAAWSRAAA
jgi:hypothetical protein